MPLDVDSLMKECSVELFSNTIAAVVQAVEVQSKSHETWSFAAASMPVSAESESVTVPVSSIPKHKNHLSRHEE